MPSTHDRAEAARDSCTGCAACDAPARREFLREAGWVLAGIAAALGLTPARAAAFHLDVIAAIGTVGDDATYPIPAGDGAMIDKGHEVILARHSGAVYAFALSCPHQRTPLRWLDDERRFQCPKHKSAYQPDGSFISGRATRGMDRYAIRRAGDTVVVDLARLFQQDRDLTDWNAALVKL